LSTIVTIAIVAAAVLALAVLLSKGGG